MQDKYAVLSRFPDAVCELERDKYFSTWMVYDKPRSMTYDVRGVGNVAHGRGLWGLGRTEEEAWTNARRTIEAHEGRKLIPERPDNRFGARGISYARYLADVLRAEAAGQDLREGRYGVHVYAMREDGTLYELGNVSAQTVYKNPDEARMAIERIKFERARLMR
jgi:hypothetical protein